MPPEFIYFDFGNVVCFFDHQQAARQMAEVSRAPLEMVRQVVFGPQGIQWRYETGQFDDRQFYDAFCSATQTRPDMSALHRANAEIFRLNATMLPLVAALADARVPLGLLSNICPSHWRTVTDGRYAIVPSAFQHCVLSFEAGALKPDPKIYQRAIELVSVAPQRIFYVDDIAGHVEGARRTGLDAVQYTTTDALAQELLKRGVRCNY